MTKGEPSSLRQDSTTLDFRTRTLRTLSQSAARGDIDAHQIAVLLKGDIAEMNPGAELDALLRHEFGIERHHAALDFAPHRTTLPNSIRMPSPVVLTMRTRLAAIEGSISSLSKSCRRLPRPRR
jgi:hypothetical protein